MIDWVGRGGHFCKREGAFAKERALLQKRGLFFKREGTFAKERAILQKRGRFCKREGTFAKERALLQKRGRFCKREGDFAKEPYENRAHFQKRLGNHDVWIYKSCRCHQLIHFCRLTLASAILGDLNT